MRYVAAVAIVTAMLAAAMPAAAGTPTITYRYKIAAHTAYGFHAQVQQLADKYGYPVHGCAFTHQRKVYGCAVSAPGDWQLFTRPRHHLYYEYFVLNNKITQRVKLQR